MLGVGLWMIMGRGLTFNNLFFFWSNQIKHFSQKEECKRNSNNLLPSELYELRKMPSLKGKYLNFKTVI